MMLLEAQLEVVEQGAYEVVLRTREGLPWRAWASLAAAVLLFSGAGAVLAAIGTSRGAGSRIWWVAIAVVIVTAITAVATAVLRANCARRVRKEGPLLCFDRAKKTLVVRGGAPAPLSGVAQILVRDVTTVRDHGAEKVHTFRRELAIEGHDGQTTSLATLNWYPWQHRCKLAERLGAAIGLEVRRDAVAASVRTPAGG